VTAALEDLAGDSGVRIVTIYGGAPYGPQLRALAAGAHIVVGTPGRVIDHLERGRLDLSGVGFVVLDEGDEMLRMGFADEVDTILDAVPTEHQTALFSATMAADLRHTVDTHLRQPRQIAVTRQASTVEGVEQSYTVVPHRQKIGALARVLATSPAEAALIFVATKAAAEEVGAALAQRGIAASVISGDVPQAERERVVARLRAGQVNVLVATDVAARGLDVDRVGLVINFDLPHDAEGYVHRIGRTGRAGRAGTAWSFVAPKETGRLRRIEKATRVPLTERPIPTPAEVSAHRLARLLEQVPARVASGRLEAARQAVAEYLAVQFAQTQPDPGSASGAAVQASRAARLEQAIDLAAALAALAVGDTGRAGPPAELEADREADQEADPSNSAGRHEPKHHRASRAERDGKRPGRTRDHAERAEDHSEWDGDRPRQSRARREDDRPHRNQAERDGERPGRNRAERDGDRPSRNHLGRAEERPGRDGRAKSRHPGKAHPRQGPQPTPSSFVR